MFDSSVSGTWQVMVTHYLTIVSGQAENIIRIRAYITCVILVIGRSVGMVWEITKEI